MLQAALWDPKGLTHINDFGDAYIMESLALAIDVFWEKFEESERQSVRAWAMVNGASTRDRAYEEYLVPPQLMMTEDAKFKVYWPLK